MKFINQFQNELNLLKQNQKQKQEIKNKIKKQTQKQKQKQKQKQEIKNKKQKIIKTDNATRYEKLKNKNQPIKFKKIKPEIKPNIKIKTKRKFKNVSKIKIKEPTYIKIEIYPPQIEKQIINELKKIIIPIFKFEVSYLAKFSKQKIMKKK